MDESINNMYFLKETITKFKSEIQKFITDPQYATNNAVNLRNSLEDLEKNINSNEKKIAGHMLNNNNLQFNPISSKYTSLSNSTNNPKQISMSDKLGNMTLRDNLGPNVNLTKSTKKLFINTNTNNTNKQNISVNNNNSYNLTKNSLKQNPNEKTKDLDESLKDNNRLSPQEILWAVNNLQKQINNNIVTNTNFDYTFGNLLNNRDTIPIDIKGISQHYDIKYLSKKLAFSNETSKSPNSSKNEKREFFVKNNLISKEVSMEEEKTKYKHTVLLRRVNDEIYDKVKNADDSRKYKLEKLKLLEKYDINKSDKEKLKVRRSVGNVNYMDKQRLNKFSFDKKSFFKSVNFDKNNIPIITPDEVDKGLMSMIIRGVIPREADLTPAFNRDGHPMVFTGGAKLIEMYKKDNYMRDEIELDNRRNIDKVKFDIKPVGNGFFITSDKNGDNSLELNKDRTNNAVRVYKPSSRNHRIKSSDKNYSRNKNISEISELDLSNLGADKYDPNTFNTNEIVKFSNNDNLEITKSNRKNSNEENYFNINQNEEEVLENSEHEKDKSKKKGLHSLNERETNIMNEAEFKEYTQSYYKTEMMLTSKILKEGQISKEEKEKESNFSLRENTRYDLAKKGKGKEKNKNKDKDKEKDKITFRNPSERNMNIKNYDLTSEDDYNNNNDYTYNDFNQNNSEEDKISTKDFMPRNLLKFNHFEIEKNEAYNEFQSKNLENWGKILQIIIYISKLFRKLNFTNEEIDSKKLRELAKDELRSISNRDIISLMSDMCLKKHGFSDKKAFHLNIKEAFIIRIQSNYRKHLAKKNFNKIKIYQKKVKKIQSRYRLYKIGKMWEAIKLEKKEESMKNHQEIMRNFKINWAKIKEAKRIEIHINSYGFKNIDNATFDKFNEKQNNQLNRIINLKDPNLEIIYICPFQIGNEILSYYFSIMSTLGIENARERFHLVVPEEIKNFSPSYSLSQMLIFSGESLRKIRAKIKGKIAYIIPGIISHNDHYLARILEIPIYAGDLNVSKSIFSKSGNKRIFELNNIPFPTSAWDIENEEEFYDSLTDLINKYMNVNVWIFKIDNEINGRGIAHLQLDKSKIFFELKTERQKNSITEEIFISDLKLFLIKSLSKFVEFATPGLFKNFKEFLKKFIEEKGVIESCPTNLISNISGSPCISMNIEPDGKLEFIGNYDKLNVNHFRNYINISPQRSLPNLNSDLLIDKIGEYLYSIEIFGYVTIELISFWDNTKQNHLAIDLKYGLNDTISCIKFCDFLDYVSLVKSNKINSYSPVDTSDNQKLPDLNLYSPIGLPIGLNFASGSLAINNHISSINKNSNSLYKKEKTDFSHIKKPFKDMDKHFRFYIPVIISKEISLMKMKDLVQLFRNELLIFDIEKNNGIVFNLPDIIQCSMFGICGIANTQIELMSIFEKTVYLLKNKIFSKESSLKTKTEFKNKSDTIDFYDLSGKIKTYIHNYNQSFAKK